MYIVTIASASGWHVQKMQSIASSTACTNDGERRFTARCKGDLPRQAIGQNRPTKGLHWAASIRHLMWKTFRDLPQIITSRDAKSACFQGSQTSCTEISSGIFWPNFGRKRSHHVMDASCRFTLALSNQLPAILCKLGVFQWPLPTSRRAYFYKRYYHTNARYILQWIQSFWLTVGSFLLTVKRFLLTIDNFSFCTYNWSFYCLQF